MRYTGHLLSHPGYYKVPLNSGRDADGDAVAMLCTVAEFGKALAMADLQSFSHQI